MKVYVAERVYDYEGTIILGVFSTKEKANNVCNDDTMVVCGKVRDCGDDHQVTEHTLDEINHA